MFDALFPLIIAALFVVFIVFLKVSEHRTNEKRKKEGKEPLTKEQEIYNVIDWTRR